MQTGFGWIEINGIQYEHDVIIHADGNVSKRKKKVSKAYKGEYGHTPLSRAELDFLSLSQGSKSLALYRCVMHEDVLVAVIRPDKPVSLFAIKPLNLADTDQ